MREVINTSRMPPRGKSGIPKSPLSPFGRLQYPELWDYEDDYKIYLAAYKNDSCPAEGVVVD